MDPSDLDSWAFKSFLKQVKQDKTLKKSTRNDVEKYNSQISKLDLRSKNKLVIIIFQYYVYEDMNGAIIKNTDINPIPYSGIQTFNAGVSFVFKKLPITLQHIIQKFLKTVSSDEL